MSETTQTTEAGTGTPASLAAKDLGRTGMFGVKAGMTQVYTPEGDLLAVTVIDLKPNVITQVKTKAKEGYNALQIGFVQKKAKSATKPEQGHAKKSSASGYYHYQELRLPEGAKLEGFQAGQVLTPDFIKAGDYVDLTAMSKGKGYQGGVKRYHMAGGFKTHGASVNHRSLGSIGNRADPGKCFKNKKMPGQMGNYNRTVQNVRVVKVDAENQLLLVHGSIPGPKSGVVTVRKAIKSIAK